MFSLPVYGLFFCFVYHEVYNAFPISAVSISIIKYSSVWFYSKSLKIYSKSHYVNSKSQFPNLQKPLLLPLECQQPYNINYPRFLSLKHIIQFINMILSVYLKCSLTFQCKKGPKTSNCMATVWSGQIIQVIQNEVVFVSFTRKL